MMRCTKQDFKFVKQLTESQGRIIHLYANNQYRRIKSPLYRAWIIYSVIKKGGYTCVSHSDKCRQMQIPSGCVS